VDTIQEETESKGGISRLPGAWSKQQETGFVAVGFYKLNSSLPLSLLELLDKLRTRFYFSKLSGRWQTN